MEYLEAWTPEDSGRRPRTADKGLFAVVWECPDGLWQATHQFNTGFELDTGAGGTCTGRMHLPAVSLQALQQLRTALKVPNAVALDVSTNDAGTLNELHGHMLHNVSGLIPFQVLQDVKTRLGKRRASRMSMRHNVAHAACIEDDSCIIPREDGKESVDIAVVTSKGLKEGKAPVVAVARLAEPMIVQVSQSKLAPARFVAIIICPESAGALASKFGEALATTFMDDDFVLAMRNAEENGPEGVFQAYESFLSNLSIVPTIHLEDLEESGGDCGLLEDTLCTGVQQRIRGERRTPTHNQVQDLLSPSVPGQVVEADAFSCSTRSCAHFYVEVDEHVANADDWRMTHRLRQGLEMDSTTQGGKPHLPRVCVTALDELQKLVAPAAVALDLVAENPVSAVNSVLDLLHRCRKDMPAAANDYISHSLVDRAVGTGVKTSSNSKISEYLGPDEADEACHVLAITCKFLPKTQPLVGVFARFRSPLAFSLPSTLAKARFVLLFVGPDQLQAKLSTLVDSIAALASDEDLMNDWRSAPDVPAFIAAFERRLSSLLVIPHARLTTRSDLGNLRRRSSLTNVLRGGSRELLALPIVVQSQPGWMSEIRRYRRETIRIMQKFSLPLIAGVFIALVWANLDLHSYEEFNEKSLTGNWHIFKHVVSLHFLVNDIFMCFFFGLAVKEVTEALLPGGSLNPINRAVNPLMATLGGVVGPALAYTGLILILWFAGAFEGLMCESTDGSGGQEQCALLTLVKGWGVPTATDISLAWMFALLVFGAGHPAINFLLLLAIVDDALGMVIIAVCYPDPKYPVEPFYLLLVIVAMVLACLMRYAGVRFWSVYILVCGPVSWLGLLKAHVHPALALVFVVPFIPAERAATNNNPDVPNLAANDWGHKRNSNVQLGIAATSAARSSFQNSVHCNRSLESLKSILTNMVDWDEAPLHVLEDQMKLPVDLGMFWFGLSNAGVMLNNIGWLTLSVLFALVVGKSLGISFFSLMASKMGFDLPPGITRTDLVAMSAMGGIGLTVALFVANEAFVDLGLRGQAKFAAVLSIGNAGLAALIRKTQSSVCEQDDGAANQDASSVCAFSASTITDSSDAIATKPSEPRYLDDVVVEEMMRLLWLQKRYRARGVHVPIENLMSASRSSSKTSLVFSPSTALPSATNCEMLDDQQRLSRGRVKLPLDLVVSDEWT